MEYTLMNKEESLLDFEIIKTPLSTHATITKEGDPKRYPFSMSDDIELWLNNRKAPKHRAHIAKLMNELGVNSLEGFASITHALSLNDTFWVQEKGQDLKWRDINLYENEFDEVVSRIAFTGGMYGQKFSTTTPETTLSGSFAKCWVREEDGIYLIKAGSDMGAANDGKEPYSEYYACQLSEIICMDATNYELVHFQGELASKCVLFTSENLGFAPCHDFVKTEKTEDIMRFYDKHDMLDEFRRMVVFDSLTLNTDRHMGNHGVLFNNDTMEIHSFAPIFDNNYSLLPRMMENDYGAPYTYLMTGDPNSKIGNDFNEVANELMTKEIRADLINLKGFEFKKHPKYNLPDNRIDVLNNLVNMQIDNIINRKSISMCAKEEKDLTQSLD